MHTYLQYCTFSQYLRDLFGFMLLGVQEMWR